MSRQVSLAIAVNDERASVLRQMAARSPRLRIVAEVSKAEALVTTQFQVAIDAATNQIQVLLLDPVALGGDERLQLERTERVIPALSWRFEPSVLEIKRALDAGKLGVPGLLRSHAWQSATRTTDVLLEHQLDLAIWMFGGRPTSVYGCQRDGYLQAHLGFKDGGMALIDIAATLAGKNRYASVSLIGSTGAIYADDHRNLNLLMAPRGPLALPVEQPSVALAGMIDAFAAVVLGQGLAANWQHINVLIDVANRVRRAAQAGQALAGGR